MDVIVLTTDLSEESKRAFAPTAKLARELGARIVLLHVVHELAALPHGAPLAPPVEPLDIGTELKQARGEIARLARTLGDNVTTEVISGVDIADSIASFAEQAGARFIALSTHGRTGVRRLMMGSIAEAVMRRASTPVLSFPQR